jgi:hypothetical protein
MDSGFVFISRGVGNGNSIPDMALKAERGSLVAACPFLGREFNLIPALYEVKPGLQAGVEWTTTESFPV